MLSKRLGVEAGSEVTVEAEVEGERKGEDAGEDIGATSERKAGRLDQLRMALARNAGPVAAMGESRCPLNDRLA